MTTLSTEISESVCKIVDTARILNIKISPFSV